MPYLYAAGLEASRQGTPVLRPMLLEFPDDPAVAYLDRQYMLGADLLVAPVFTESGEVEFYLPAGLWTSYLTGDTVQGPAGDASRTASTASRCTCATALCCRSALAPTGPTTTTSMH